MFLAVELTGITGALLRTQLYWSVATLNLYALLYSHARHTAFSIFLLFSSLSLFVSVSSAAAASHREYANNVGREELLRLWE